MLIFQFFFNFQMLVTLFHSLLALNFLQFFISKKELKKTQIVTDNSSDLPPYLSHNNLFLTSEPVEK